MTATAITTVAMVTSLGAARGNDTRTAAPAHPGVDDGPAPDPDAAWSAESGDLAPIAPETTLDSVAPIAPDTSLDAVAPGAPDGAAETLDSREPWRDSVSCGAANRGALYDAVLLPREGAGYVTPEPWWSRGRRYGTEELVGLIARAAARVAAEHPGGLLGVADLSAENGGAIAGHRSHQSGRDADLVFYALDPAGKPFSPDQHMAYYTRSGMGRWARAPSFTRDIAERYFDLARNWALVRAMLTDAEADVEHIFVSARVRRWLLGYARQIGEPEELVNRAARVLRHPRGVDGHNDHMHVRVRCSADDEELGRCRNVNASRPRRARRWRSSVACPARRTPAALVSTLPGLR